MPLRLSDQDQNSVKTKADQYQTKTVQYQVKISVLRSGVILDVQFKNEAYSLLKNESPYDEILSELEGGRIEVKKNDEKYK